MNDGREEDLRILSEAHDREQNPDTRRNIADTMRKVANESGAVKSMREALIKAHRDGNKDEIRDIHDYIKDKQKYG